MLGFNPTGRGGPGLIPGKVPVHAYWTGETGSESTAQQEAQNGRDAGGPDACWNTVRGVSPYLHGSSLSGPDLVYRQGTLLPLAYSYISAASFSTCPFPDT